jgi:hypothetical protein
MSSGRYKQLRNAFGFLYQWFSSPLHDEARRSETNKAAARLSDANHGSMGDS